MSSCELLSTEKHGIESPGQAQIELEINSVSSQNYRCSCDTVEVFCIAVRILFLSLVSEHLPRHVMVKPRTHPHTRISDAQPPLNKRARPISENSLRFEVDHDDAN